MLFIFSSRLLLYSPGSGMNRVQVVLSEFNVRLLCFVQAKCMYVWLYICIGCIGAWVYRCYSDFIFVRHDLNRCFG